MIAFPSKISKIIIEKLEILVKDVQTNIDNKTKELQKMQKGIGTAQASLAEQGVDLEKLVQEI